MAALGPSPDEGTIGWLPLPYDPGRVSVADGPIREDGERLATPDSWLEPASALPNGQSADHAQCRVVGDGAPRDIAAGWQAANAEHSGGSHGDPAAGRERAVQAWSDGQVMECE